MGSGTVSSGEFYPPMIYSEETRGQSWAANPQISDKNKQINVWSGSYGVDVPDSNPSDIYARGHQIPNSDRSANDLMQTQTYYATNSTPQIQNRFNGYIWNRLEDAVRDCVKDTVYVVTGAAFRKTGGSETINYIQPAHDTKRCPVPNYYWKVLLKVKRSGSTITSASAIGFWYEHREYNTGVENVAYSDFACSVDQIEVWTGFDLFTNLPGTETSGLEKLAEGNSDWQKFITF